MQDLKLIALDAEDLEVISANLQDAVLRVGDIAYLKGQKRFAAIANRFDWGQASAKEPKKKAFTRRRSGLRFERVLGAKVTQIDLRAKDLVLSLLSRNSRTSAPLGAHAASRNMPLTNPTRAASKTGRNPHQWAHSARSH
jgi:hypothetical protein